MTPSPFLSPDTEPAEELHAASPTAHLLDELALYGHRPGRNEPDPRPLPEADAVRAEIGAIVDGFAAMLADTRLEDDLDDLLWSFVNLFHRKIGRVERDLDANEQAQRRSQREQNGSEVRSVELERLIDQGIGLIERRNAFEFCRDHAAEHYEAVTGSLWRPRSGSMVNHRALTSAMIDSREFIAAQRRAERIAACWADNRKVVQVAFKPDWNRHRNAAPFKRNDEMLDVLPIGVIAFPGSGISANLADKARKMGIPVWRFTEESGA